MPQQLILASASPRRLELLAQLGLDPLVQPVDIDETAMSGELAVDLASRLAKSKAMAVQADEAVVIGADTVVSLNGVIAGKPQNRQHGIDMLLSLAGKTHSVCTGVCVRSMELQQVLVVETAVTLADIKPLAAEQYWQSGEPLGKAGGYALQGIGAVFVAGLQGSYSNVVGLPLYETALLLEKFGLPVLNDHLSGTNLP
jgi:septum formation protein